MYIRYLLALFWQFGNNSLNKHPQKMTHFTLLYEMNCRYFVGQIKI